MRLCTYHVGILKQICLQYDVQYIDTRPGTPQYPEAMLTRLEQICLWIVQFCNSIELLLDGPSAVGNIVFPN